MEIFYGTLFGQSTGVAHWAHVGGFVAGMLAALVIQRTGLEHKANAVIEDKIAWTADPAVVQGTELMEKGNFDEAISVLQKHVAAKPEAVDAHSLLRQLHWRKNDIPAHLAATAKLCQLHLKAQDHDAALEDFQEYTNAGGDRMPAATWLELCRIFEGQQNFKRAVEEYGLLAKAHPTERPSLLALLSAGRPASRKRRSNYPQSFRFRKPDFQLEIEQRAIKDSQPFPTARIGIVTVADASEEASMWQRPSKIPPGSITMHGA
jgi:tetratricopeptide (TPR) repeat protein